MASDSLLDRQYTLLLCVSTIQNTSVLMNLEKNKNGSLSVISGRLPFAIDRGNGRAYLEIVHFNMQYLDQVWMAMEEAVNWT